MINEIDFEVQANNQSYKYCMLTLPVPTALKILTRLTKIVSGTIGESLNSLNSIDQEIDMALIGKACEALSTRLDEAETWDTIKTLLSTVKRIDESTGNRIKINVDNEFQGKLGLMFQVVIQTIKYNYEDFLTQAQSGFAYLQTEGMGMSKNATSIGINGGQS